MKVLVTGANGFLGQHLCRFLQDAYEVIATGKGAKRIPFDGVNYHSVDITDNEAFLNVTSSTQPDIIIHAAAMSKPDECEHNKRLCDIVNVEGTKSVINGAKGLIIPPHLIYISSDFVLGEGGPHDETAVPSPLNYYGNSKLQAEHLVEGSGLFYSIVRPVFMYGETWQGMRPTFLHWVKESLEAGKKIKVVNDQFRTPTYVKDICKGITAIIEKRAGGLYHLGGIDSVTPCQMAVQFAELAGLNSNSIEAVTAETFAEPVKRARKAGVVIKKAMSGLDYAPLSLDQGLRTVIANLK